MKQGLKRLGAIVTQWDPSAFVWHNKSELNVLLCTHVGAFLFARTLLFLSNIISLFNPFAPNAPFL